MRKIMERYKPLKLEEAKKYISNGIKNSGRYITFQTSEKKNYLKVEDVTKIFHFGSFCFY